MSILTIREKGKHVLATGNEAIARGAIEAGIGFASTYPGTPASQIGDSFYNALEGLPGLHFEYSINEKVAIEGAIGAAWAGIRSIVSMKAPGFNLVSEPLFPICYYGVRGLVIVNGADPGQQASSTEQDNRWYSISAHIPLIEPSTVQEAKDFTVKAFELSDRLGVPFMINIPNDLCHGSGMLTLGDAPEALPARGKFQGPLVERTLRGTEGSVHRKLLQTEQQIRDYATETELNRIFPGQAPYGIITSSIAWAFTMEALDLLGLHDVPVLKLGLVNPMSPALLKKFMEGLSQVIVVEQLDPFMESEIKKIAYELDLRVPVIGKKLFPEAGAFDTSMVVVQLSKHLGVPLPEDFRNALERRDEMAKVPGMFASQREGALCAGCGHRGAAFALKKAAGDNLICGADIGCYGSMLRGKPWNLSDWSLCMGSGIGVAQGLSQKVDDKPIVAMIGDSTLFHAGLPAVLNAAYHHANVLLMVLDNRWTALTGHQLCPSTVEDVRGEPMEYMSIEDMLRGLGVKYVVTSNPYRPNQMAEDITEALKQPGFKVIITEGECVLQTKRRERFRGQATKTYKVDRDLCVQCDLCYSEFTCPATERRTENGETIYSIESSSCTGCGACADICPVGAIVLDE